MKTTLFRNLALGAGALLVFACSSEDPKPATTNSTSTTTSSGGSGGSGSGSGGSSSTTTNAGSGGSAGSGGAGSSTGGSGGSGGAGTSGGAGGSSGGSGGSAGSAGSAGAGGSGGSGGAGGSGGSGDAGVACNVNPGKALQFNGTAVDILSGDLGADFPGGDVPRTIEVWAKFLGTASFKAEGSIIETGLAMGGQNKVMGIDLSGYMGTTAEFGPYTNGYSDNNHPNGVFVMNIPQMGWLHLSWSYTGNHGTFSFTVDGTEYPITPGAGQPTLALTPGIVTLAASQTFGTQGWTGVLDEVRLWSVAKTPAEIKRDMKVVLKGTEPGLVAYYRFDEGTGTFTDDVSKKASHRLSTCTAINTTTCHAVNAAAPMWVASDIPGPFTCAP